MPRLTAVTAAICAALAALVLPVRAEDLPQVRLPKLNVPDRSGAVGGEMRYLAQRQLGADCRERLRFGGESYLPELFTNSEPGKRMGEHQIRPYTTIALAGAVLARFGRYDSTASGIERPEMERIVVSLAGELSAHHVANTDKSSWWWGNEWQSAYWTAQVGTGAWLMWDRLPEETRRQVTRMVVFEADRFLAGPAPFNEFSDTKCEENAWNSQAITLAQCMFPTHPHAAAWREKAIEYMVSAYAAPQDLQSTEVIDGKPVKDWLRGPNIHADYTLENHGFFHPDYLVSYYLSLTNLPVYRLAEEPVPDAPMHNLRQCWEIMNFLCLPNGWLYYPQFNDWSNYRHECVIAAQIAAPLMPGRMPATCLKWGLDFLRHVNDSRGGEPATNLFRGLNFNCCPLCLLTETYLSSYLFGPVGQPLADDEACRKLAGTRLFEGGKFVLCRSERSIASFSWFDTANRLMAVVTPLSRDAFALPKYRSLVGVVGPKADAARILHREVHLLPGGGFSVGLSLERGTDLAIRERVMMVALADGRTVYVEAFDGQPEHPAEVRTGLVFFENDPYWLRGAEPAVFHAGGAWRRGSGRVILSGSDAAWFNLGNRMGIVARGAAASAIDEGQLALNYRPAGAKPVERVVAVFYPGLSAEETRKLSSALRVEDTGGGALRVDLGDVSVTVNPSDSSGANSQAPLTAIVTTKRR